MFLTDTFWMNFKMLFLTFAIAIVAFQPISVTSNTPCEENGYTFTEGIGCHKLHNNNNNVSNWLNWTEAQAVCKSEDANLAIIHSEAEAEHILKMIHSAKTNNVWVGVRSNGTNWITVSGTPLENTGYNQFVYSDLKDQVSYVTNECLVFSLHHKLNRTGFIISECDRKMESYICRKESVRSRRDDTVSCEKDGYIYKPQIGCHRLYKVSELINWANAQKACQMDGANLTIINSEDEAEYLGSLLGTNNKLAWVGVHEENGKWVIVNGEELNSIGYNKWYTTHPNTPLKPLNNQCLTFVHYPDMRGLMSEGCKAGLKTYICEKSLFTNVM